MKRLLLGCLCGFALLGLAGGAVWATTDVPLLGEAPTPQRSVVLWADGSEMGRVGPVDRVVVPFEQVSTAARQAVLAAEDRGFYSQPGISVRGAARTLWVNLRGGESSQGGSTITQQYVRNAVLSQERTLSRKLREVAIAVKLDATTPKDVVLERYLNTVYFGRGAHGVEAAAQACFGVPASGLTAEQGAVLASQLALAARATTPTPRPSGPASGGGMSSTAWSSRAGSTVRPSASPTRTCWRASRAPTPSAGRPATWWLRRSTRCWPAA